MMGLDTVILKDKWMLVIPNIFSTVVSRFCLNVFKYFLTVTV